MALGNVGSMAVALLGDMKDFDRKMDGATKKVSTFDKTVKKMGASVTKYAKAAALAATAAVTAFGISAVKTFVDFDTGMREVFTLMPELSAEAREEMTEDVQALAEEIAVIPTEVIPALYQAISAGVPRENVFTFLEIAGKAAIGGVTSLEVAVDGLTTVTNAYGAEVISVTEVADIMFTTVKEGKTTFDELAARLFQAVPVAAKIGLEFHNIAAAAAQITLSGVPMRVAMTQIRSLLNEVAFEGKELNKVFVEASGQTFPQFIESGGDIADIIEILQGAADGAGISIAELTANLEAQGALLNLSGVSLGNLKDILDEMSNSAGAADTAYEEMAAGVQYELDQLAVWWQNLKLDVGGDLTENLQDLLGWLEDNQEAIGDGIKAVFDGLIDGLEWLTNNADAVKTSLIAIGAGMTAMMLASAGIPQLAAALAVILSLPVGSGFDGATESIESFNRGLLASAKTVEEVTELMHAQSSAILQSISEIEGYDDGATQAFRNVQFSLIDLQDDVIRAGGVWEDLGLSSEQVAALMAAAWTDGVAEIRAALDAAIEAAGETSEALEVLDETDMSQAIASIGQYGHALRNALKETLRLGSISEDTYVSIIRELAALDEAVLKLEPEEMMSAFLEGTDEVLEKYGEFNDSIDALRVSYVGIVPSAQEFMRSLLGIRDLATSTVLTAQMMTGAWHDVGGSAGAAAAEIEVAGDDIIATNDEVIESQGLLFVGYTDLIEAMMEANAEIQSDYEQMWEGIKSNAADALVDLLTDFATYGSTREQEEEDHQERIARIREEYAEGSQTALETALGIEQSEYEAHRTTVGGVLRDMFGDFTTFLADQLLALSAAEAVKSVAAFLSLNPVQGTASALAAGRYLVGAGALAIFASSIPGFAEGGIVPGPAGSAQMAVVHGGEEVVTQEQQDARAIDYAQMGAAVYAGTYDALKELEGEAQPAGVSNDFITRLAQGLYPALQVESERRGGTIL